MKHVSSNPWLYFMDGMAVGANAVAGFINGLIGSWVSVGFHVLLVGVFAYSAYTRNDTKETDETR